MSYPYTPYEVEIHDQDGLVDCIATYRTQWQALESIPSHTKKLQAEALENPEDYAGCFLRLVKHEVDGMQEWREPMEDFQIFS